MIAASVVSADAIIAMRFWQAAPVAVALAAGVIGLGLELPLPLPEVGTAVGASEDRKPEAVGRMEVEFCRKPAHDFDDCDHANEDELGDAEDDELVEKLSEVVLLGAAEEELGVGVGVGVGDGLLDGAADEELEPPEPLEFEEPPLPPVITKLALTPCGTVTTQKLAPPAPSLCWPTS